MLWLVFPLVLQFMFRQGRPEILDFSIYQGMDVEMKRAAYQRKVHHLRIWNFLMNLKITSIHLVRLAQLSSN